MRFTMKLFIFLMIFWTFQNARAENYLVITKNDSVTKNYAQQPNVLSSWTGAISGFEIDLTEEEAKDLKTFENFLVVEKNGVVHANTDAWGLDRIDSRKGLDGLFRAKGQGKDVDIYILDTGIIEHEEFEDRIKSCLSFIEGESCTDSVSGHGTHVASTAAGRFYGVAPSANIHAYKVLGNNGGGSWSGIVRALNKVISNESDKVSVVNMSLGGAGRSEAIKRAIDAAIGANIVVVVAAGNSNRDACNYSPAFVPSALTVGSTSRDDKRSSFSNYGACVDTFGPGSSIKAAYNRSSSSYATLSGTSMASPHVAGAAAIEIALHPELNASSIAKKIVAETTKEVVEDAKSENDYMLFVGKKDKDDSKYFLAEKGESCQLSCTNLGLQYDIDAIAEANDASKCEQAIKSISKELDGSPREVTSIQRMIGCAYRKNKRGKNRAIFSSFTPEIGAARKVWQRVCACK